MKDFYFNFTNFILKNSKKIILIVAVLTAILGYFSTKIGVDSNMFRMLPKNHPILKEYNKEQKLMDTNEIMVTVFYLNDNIKPLEIAQYFSDEMNKISSFSGFTTDINFLLSYGFLYLDNTSLIQSISDSVNNITKTISRSNALDFKTMQYLDKAIGNVYELENNLKKNNSENILKSYYIISPDKKIMLMGVSFTTPTSNLSFVSKIVPKTKSILKKINSKFNIKTGLTGSYITEYESNKSVSEDFKLTSVITILSILILFFISFGDIIVTLIVFASLGISFLLTMGITQIMFKELNIITNFMAAVVLGLGIDYGIHIVTRIINEIKSGNSFEKSLEITYETALLPLFFSLLTTVAVFLSLVIMGLPAFTEMAFISSIGLIVFFCIMLFFVPSVIYLIKNKLKINNFIEKINKVFKLLSIFIPNHSKKIKYIIYPFLVFFVIIGFYNTSNFFYTAPGLIPKNSESVIVGNDIVKHMGKVDLFDDLKYKISVDDDVDKIEQKLLSSGVIKNAQSLSDIIEKQIGDFSTLKSRVTDLSQMINNPLAVPILKKYNMYSDSLKLIEISAKSKDLYQFSLNSLDIIPSQFKSNFLIEDNGKKYMLLNIKPAFNLWKNNGIKIFYEKLGKDGNNVLNTTKTIYKLMKLVKEKFIAPVIIAFILIAFLTYISRKSFVETFQTFVGLLFVALSTFGIVYFFNIRMTFITMLTFPLIFGIGADGFIHIFHAIDEDKQHYWQTLKSVTLSFATSILSFLSFQVARGDLLKQFSLSMVIGILLTWIFTVILIPTIKFKTIKKFYKKLDKTLVNKKLSKNK
ncbi:transporter [Tepiditoga spiralis]|uniref:Transporter n=1 Tax=Tepiditoga spiralis TaxID=2108365 RepID=A0A7G1G2J8_9BACT|nr:MMPL family transporter [Tepiditoga spiralis]BBE30590.1 transporter [Tepiditoga spiralis]